MKSNPTPFATFGYLDNQLHILPPGPSTLVGYFDTVQEDVSYDNLRMLGTMLKDWIMVKQIEYCDHLFTFDAGLNLVKIERIIKQMVYPLG